MELFTDYLFPKQWIGIIIKHSFNGPFTREKNWVRTRGKSSTDCIILSVKTDNNFPPVGQKVGIAQSLDDCFYTIPLGTGSTFNMGVRYCACDQRNYY